MHRFRQGSSLFGVILVGCAESILLALKPTQNSKPPGSVQMRPLVLIDGFKPKSVDGAFIAFLKKKMQERP
jgi:hypothetical protein